MNNKKDLKKKETKKHELLGKPSSWDLDTFFSKDLDKMLQDLSNIRNYMDSFIKGNLFELPKLDKNAIRSSEFMIEEGEKEYKISVILQNVTKDMIDLNITKGVLYIYVEKKESDESKEEDDSYRYVSHSRIRKAIKLPDNANIDQIDVSYKDDILRIKIPKLETMPPKMKKLEVK